MHWSDGREKEGCVGSAFKEGKLTEGRRGYPRAVAKKRGGECGQRGCMERGRNQKGAAPILHFPAQLWNVRYCLASRNLGARQARYILEADFGD